MITRLKVQGFKNLYDVEVYFGPFTCLAGTNGVGKSNLFDALRFLGELSNKTLLEAALSIRNASHDKRSKSLDIRNIFFNNGRTYTDQILLEADLILPPTAVDDLGQTAEATTNFVTYRLVIGYNEAAQNRLEIREESLRQLNQTDYKKVLGRIGYSKEWIKSVSGGVRRSASAFIETQDDKVSISQDQNKGRNKSLPLKSLPRTILSTATAIETPTALVCKREIESWRFLQLEPSALRSPDDVADLYQRMDANGAHLPATLYRMSNQDERIRVGIANRLSDLIDDVFELYVDRDEKRDLLTLMLKAPDRHALPASSLSDGTLRFLALSMLEADPSEQGLVCLEEPENGIHPARIPSILRLLQDIATDTESAVGADNPLRQVIINTHSPLVVSEITEDALLMAELIEYREQTSHFEGAIFKPLSNTWRAYFASEPVRPVSKATLLKYLSPLYGAEASESLPVTPHKRKIKEREEVVNMQLSLFAS